MIELKNVKGGLTKHRIENLAQIIHGLKPGEDFHFMSLDFKILESCLAADIAPRSAFLTVGETNLGQASEFALREQIGGVTGHYLLMTNAMIREHHEAGQRVGTGFVESKSVLWRELKRGVDWIFSDSAVDRARDVVKNLSINGR
jgi:glycerophosphoryl diester phosphodiesterase